MSEKLTIAAANEPRSLPKLLIGLVLTIAGTNFAVVRLSVFYYLASMARMTELPELSQRRAGIWIVALSFAIWIALYEIAAIIWHLV